MRIEVALQLGFCSLCLTLTLLGGGMYVSLLFHLHNSKDLVFIKDLVLEKKVASFNMCISGEWIFLIHQQLTVVIASGQSGVHVILARKSE